MNICFFGSARECVGQKYKEESFLLGKEMAKRGHTLVFGGGGKGLMGAVARGVKEGGGKIIGVIPRFFSEDNLEEAFCHCTELRECDTMSERKQIMESLADAFIIAPGGVGTYDEFFEVLCNKQLARHNKPIALINTDGFYEESEIMMTRAIEKGFVAENCRLLYRVFVDYNEALSFLEASGEVKK